MSSVVLIKSDVVVGNEFGRNERDTKFDEKWVAYLFKQVVKIVWSLRDIRWFGPTVSDDQPFH